MLVYEEDVLLETGVQVRFQAKFSNDGVVMTVNVGIDTVHAFENLAHQGWKRLWKRYTNATGHDGLVVNTSLDPCHELLDVGWCGHFRGTFEALVVLPEILEPVRNVKDSNTPQKA